MRLLRICVIGVVIFTTVGSGAVLAVSGDVAGLVSMNCGRIGGQLENVRYYDRRAREYLGNRYEKMISGYVTNLNVRLVRNSIVNTELQDLQAELVVAHAGFKGEYAKYANEMDGLIETDCVSSPEDFYGRLLMVREMRADVRGYVGRVNEGLYKYRGVVAGMRDGL